MDRTRLDVVTDLTPVAERLLERHLAGAKEWFPHEFVPWSRGRDFAPGEVWDENEVALDPAVRSSLFVNLLTEDNLPYYTAQISNRFGTDGAWGTWVRRWTAEEGRHSIVLRDYLTVTRTIDPVALERARMAQVECGQVPDPPTIEDSMVYVALQELATRIAHHNTGKVCSDPAAYEVMKRIASDENRHYLFYRDLCTAALERDPSTMVCAMERQVRTFEMPGTGIVDFAEHAACDRARRHLRLLGALRADPRPGRAPPLERRSARGPHARGRSSPRRARHPHRSHRPGRSPNGEPARRERPRSRSPRSGSSTPTHQGVTVSWTQPERVLRVTMSACSTARGRCWRGCAAG